MADCKTIKNLSRGVCIGAMDRRIEIDTRNIAPPSLGSVDYGELFTPLYQVWANITTEPRVTEFDNTNIERVITHIMVIRYKDDVTAQSWIRFDNKFFDIIRTENLEHRNDYLKMMCSQRGLDTQPSNFA